MNAITPPHALAGLLRAAATPEALGHLILRGDPQYRSISGHVPGRARSTMVVAALADGEAWAARVRARWGSVSASALPGIAREMHLTVETSVQEGGFGSSVFFAEYCARSKVIRLYAPAIRRLDAALVAPSWRAWPGITETAPIFLAHEIYHHLDGTGRETPIARRHRVVLLRVGPWRWTSGIAALGEIAAGRFAQRLLGLPVHAGLLDILARHAVDPGGALRIAESLAPMAD